MLKQEYATNVGGVLVLEQHSILASLEMKLMLAGDCRVAFHTVREESVLISEKRMIINIRLLIIFVGNLKGICLAYEKLLHQ
jgi:hypothetical protein